VAPAAHYYIGGVQTDLDGRASIPRLYAVGECSNTGVHGANRLAGNSLAEALVFGRRAAKAIAAQRHGPTKALPEPPELEDSEIDVAAAWTMLRERCESALGIEREPAELAHLIDEIEPLALVPPSPDRNRLELRAGAIAARLIARSALLRNESRGVHYRRDHPDPIQSWAGVRLRLARGAVDT
jgi:L-aspartate oxidase